MKAISRFKFPVCVILVLAGALVLNSHAAAPDPAKDANGISHFVRFEVGGTQLRNGDRITIDEIHGTSDKVAVGNLYEIKGTYTLASLGQARLTADITSSDPRHFPPMNTQTMTVDKGDGHFTLYLYMWCEGNPHLSFYPMDRGSSFASVYFGTGESVLKHVSWLDDAGH